MIIGVPKEIKKDEYRVGLLPVGADLLTRDGHTVLIENEAGLGSGFDDQRYAAAGAKIVSHGRGDLRPGGDDRQGQGAPAAGDRQAPPRADPVLLLPLRRLAGTDGRLPGRGHHGRGVRDAPGRRGPAAPADAHERDRRTHVHPGRGQVPRTADDGPGHPARRRPGRRAGQRGRPRRRGRRHQRRPHGRGTGRQRHPHGHQPRPPPLPRRRDARQRHDDLLRPAHDRGLHHDRRPGDRRRADPRRPGPRPGAAIPRERR